MNNIIDEFVIRLLEEKGIANLEPVVVDQMKLDLASQVEDYINVALIEQMSPETLKEFDKVLSKKKPEAIQDFLQKNIPDLDQVIGDALLRFRITYIGA